MSLEQIVDEIAYTACCRTRWHQHAVDISYTHCDSSSLWRSHLATNIRTYRIKLITYLSRSRTRSP